MISQEEAKLEEYGIEYVYSKDYLENNRNERPFASK